MPRSNKNQGAQSGRSILKKSVNNSSEPSIDTEKLKQRMEACGIPSITALADIAGIVRGTVYNVLNRGSGTKETMDRIVKALDTCEADLRRHPTLKAKRELPFELVMPDKWKLISVETLVLVAVNGVSYQVAKLESELNPKRYSRAKFYNLRGVRPAKFPELIERLARHAKVLTAIGNHPQVARHIDIRPLDGDTAWWVLDEWVDSTTLESLLEAGTQFPFESVKDIGTQLLNGLSTLHEQQVLVRELAPERILIVDGSQQCIITDFELAKLLDSDISVSGKWKLVSPYRAEEICGDDRNFQSDLFSWGVIITELLTGTTNADKEQLKAKLKDRSILNLILKCRDSRYHYRPPSAKAVLEIWRNWKL